METIPPWCKRTVRSMDRPWKPKVLLRTTEVKWISEYDISQGKPTQKPISYHKNMTWTTHKTT
jgi:hypothetical protein